MALSRGMTALRAALGAVGGGLEGYAQMQELERKREFEREKEKAAAARQAMLDAATLRREEREVASTMIPAERFASMTMPGATPLQPALRQTIGGKEYVYAPQIATAEKHRADVMKERGERQKSAQERTALQSALANVEIGGRRIGDEQAAALAALGSNERTVLLSAMRDAARPQRMAGGGKEEPSDTEKRMLGAQFLSSQTFNPALTKALQTTFARDPSLAADPEMAAYDIMKSKTVKPITPMQRYKPPVPKDDKNDLASRIIEQVKTSRAGAATGAPAAQPAAPAPEAPAAPAPAAKAPAQPSLTDAAAKQASRAELWDKLKAQNPKLSDDEITARVMREIP